MRSTSGTRIPCYTFMRTFMSVRDIQHDTRQSRLSRVPNRIEGPYVDAFCHGENILRRISETRSDCVSSPLSRPREEYDIIRLTSELSVTLQPSESSALGRESRQSANSKNGREPLTSSAGRSAKLGSAANWVRYDDDGERTDDQDHGAHRESISARPRYHENQLAPGRVRISFPILRKFLPIVYLCSFIKGFITRRDKENEVNRKVGNCQKITQNISGLF